MEGAPRRNHTISTIAAIFMTDDSVEEEMVKEFEQRARDRNVLTLMNGYENKLACRWNAQYQLTILLEQFQELTNSYGEHFASHILLRAWIKSYVLISELVQTITHEGLPGDDDYNSFRLTCSIDSLRMLLEIRYQFVYLPYLSLRWTHFCRNNECDVPIFMTAVTTAHLIDNAIEEEANYFILNVQEISNTLSEHPAKEIIDSINEHKAQIRSSMWPLLESVRDSLRERVPSYSHVKPLKSPITFSEFNDPRFYKI